MHVTPNSPKRRRVLAGIAALVGAGYLPPGLAQTGSASAGQFTALSKTFTGFAYDDPQLAAALLRALAADVGGATLSRIAALASSTPADTLTEALRAAKLDTAAARVVVALYSGVVQTPKGPIVFTYDQALAWQAVPWTKPNALCGGATDYWASAPAESK
ncbi:MAG: hypothetical protein IT518_25435 [Burkholderiales bacterium]|nr:hypothetical protein [Burkholderiales bacterium]